MTQGKNVFQAHVEAKKSTSPRIVLVSGNKELRDRYDGKTVAEICAEYDVDPETGVEFAQRDWNGNIIHNIIITIGGVETVFPLSRSLSALMDEEEITNGLEILDWECRKIDVPLTDDQGQPTGETKESMNLGKPSGVLTFDSRVVAKFDNTDVEPVIAETPATNTAATRTNRAGASVGKK